MTTAEKPNTEVRKALDDVAARQADLDAARDRASDLAQADEAAVRRTIAAEIRAAHAAAVEALRSAQTHVSKVTVSLDAYNELDAGRLARPATGVGRGRRIEIPLPRGWKDLAGVLEVALGPLGPLPTTSPTLLHSEVRDLADEVHQLTRTSQVSWQDPQWRGVWAAAVNENRTLEETLQVKQDLERMRDHGRQQPVKPKDEAA